MRNYLRSIKLIGVVSVMLLSCQSSDDHIDHNYFLGRWDLDGQEERGFSLIEGEEISLNSMSRRRGVIDIDFNGDAFLETGFGSGVSLDWSYREGDSKFLLTFPASTDIDTIFSLGVLYEFDILECDVNRMLLYQEKNLSRGDSIIREKYTYEFIR